MEENKHHKTKIIVIFKKDYVVDFNDKKRGALDGSTKLEDLLQSFEATMEKMFPEVEDDYTEKENLELYFAVYTNRDGEKLKNELLKLKFVDAAYIKSKDVDPGM